VDEKPCFSIPLSNVSNCSTGAKNEAILEFHQNDDCPVSLAEMRFHIPQPDADEDVDPVEVNGNKLFWSIFIKLLIFRNFARQ
jgi:hypothetical protein